MKIIFDSDNDLFPEDMKGRELLETIETLAEQAAATVRDAYRCSFHNHRITWPRLMEFEITNKVRP